MSDIKQYLEILQGPLVTGGLLGFSALLMIIIFFINFKKKAGLIYMAVSLLLSAGVLFSMSAVIDAVSQAFAAEYSSLVTAAAGGIIKEATIIGAVFSALAIGFIALFIVLKNKKQKEVAEVKEEATANI